MVEGLYVVLNVMLSLMSVMNPPLAWCNLSVRMVMKYFGCVCFWRELGFLNCDDICMCVVNKQFELLEFLLFLLTCNTVRFLSLLLLGLCPCVVSVAMWSSLLSVVVVVCPFQPSSSLIQVLRV